jgi:uncharacterized protein (DUF1015 family)
MAEIQPFRGIRYNSQKVELKEVITEPYDRIPPSLQEEYYRRNPYNAVRIILGKEDDPEHQEKDKYKRAKIYLDRWQEEGILIREDKEALYIYEQEFEVAGQTKMRRGLVTRVRLEEFSSKKVLPHEKTFPKHKVDRLNLLRATNTNTGQIFLLYQDDDRSVSRALEDGLTQAELAVDLRDEEGFRHRLWVIKDKEIIQKIKLSMADRILIIADGHHRYETSLNFQKERTAQLEEVRGTELFHYVMMTLFRLDDPGLVILPTYRLVKGLDKLSEKSLRETLSPYFNIQELSVSDPSAESVLADVRSQVQNEPHTFAAYVAPFEKFMIFRLKSEELLDKEINEGKSKQWKRLNVAILHSLIIDKLASLSSSFSLEENVSYIRNLDEGLGKVKDGEFQMIFLLCSASLHQIREVVESGELMPHKSTDFFPKLKSGLVMNPLDE